MEGKGGKEREGNYELRSVGIYFLANRIPGNNYRMDTNVLLFPRLYFLSWVDARHH